MKKKKKKSGPLLSEMDAKSIDISLIAQFKQNQYCHLKALELPLLLKGGLESGF